MFNRGKVGICLECGSVFDAMTQRDRVRKSILQFLSYFDIISSSVTISSATPKRFIGVYKVAHKKSETLSFSREYADFEPLQPREVFARDEGVEYVAGPGDCIIFPRTNGAVGSEAFIIGKEI